jgi:regulator of replication initiation timing
MTAQQYIQQQHELRQDIKKMQQQVDQIAEAHQAAMTQNQALQLANDNLSVQVKVLQSEQSAQMFLYGAATIGVGGVLGFMLGSVMARRQRRW